MDVDQERYVQIGYGGINIPYNSVDPSGSNIPVAPHIISNYLYFDRQLNFWISTAGEIIKIDFTGKRKQFSVKNGQPANGSTYIFQDKEDNIWITNEETGLGKLANQDFEFYKQPESGFNIADIYVAGVIRYLITGLQINVSCCLLS